MATPAQFHKGQLVRYTDGALDEHIARIDEVTQAEPAQYRITVLSDDGPSTEETCGEGIDEPGAVSAL